MWINISESTFKSFIALLKCVENEDEMLQQQHIQLFFLFLISALIFKIKVVYKSIY